MSENFSVITVIGNELHVPGHKIYYCAIGKCGFSGNKREGDGCTPLGVFSLRECLYRADKMAAPQTQLPVRIINKNDGWCDDPKSPDYNRIIKRPYNFSYELLWRDDNMYDVIIPIGYNDDPVVTGKGSAIFMHIAKKDYIPTEGCVALALPDMLALIPHLTPKCQIEIKAE